MEFVKRRTSTKSKVLVEQFDDMTLTDLRLSIVKPQGAKWMVDLYSYIKQKPKIVCNGFKQNCSSNSDCFKLSMNNRFC